MLGRFQKVTKLWSNQRKGEPKIPQYDSKGEMDEVPNFLSDPKNTIRIITDEPSLEYDALGFDSYSQKLTDIIINSNPRFAVGIFGGWGTGKTTLMRIIQGKLRNRDNILVVWFDAWKYEKEKYLAVLPLIRTIELELENKLIRLKKGDNSYSEIAEKWNQVRIGLQKTFDGFIEATNLQVGIGTYGSAGINLARFREVLRADAQPIDIGDERIYRHYTHMSEYLEHALSRLRDRYPKYRIVVFIDDLDRCSPEKAIEILESLKTFFDIEGFVYVIGMDSETINSIVRKKYGDDFSKGQEYMEKIVQLPFQVPGWKEGWGDDAIAESISKIISNGLTGPEISIEEKDLIEELNRNNKLIAKAVRKNPREAKRFINNVILAKAVYNKKVDELIVIQAFTFRQGWKRFLELITEFPATREFFFKEYDELEIRIKKIINGEENWDKFSRDDILRRKYPSFNNNLKIYKEIVNQGEDLKSFIDMSRNILRGISNIDELRRDLYITKPDYWATREGWEAENRVEQLLYRDKWPERFKERKIIPLQEVILFERDFLASVHEWFANMTNKELMLEYLPIHELTMTRLRDQINELKEAHDVKSTKEKEIAVLENQEQIAETLKTIYGKMPV